MEGLFVCEMHTYR
ncbi:hypothetical protein B4U80_01042 [Leptotrombidium deliense]|uniref:Uncharacterized protein n=1 Tax=Leptotrombidium deliense TaxID=299467 RepID=A0A443SRJ7_9ACAR|nr:hypothetical protein B4U80_01042 [Leptotrombidium deliense]